MCFVLIEYIPLQQGLRLYMLQGNHLFHNLIEYIPLQQGLRQYSEIMLFLFSH